MFAPSMLLWLLCILALEVSYFVLFGWRRVSYYNNDKNLFLYRKSAGETRRRQSIQESKEEPTSTANNSPSTRRMYRFYWPFFLTYIPLRKYGRNNSISPSHSSQSASSSRASSSKHVVINFDKNNDFITSKNGSARSSIASQRWWLTDSFSVP